MADVKKTNLWTALKTLDWAFIKRFLSEPKISITISGKVILTYFLLDCTVSICKITEPTDQESRQIVWTARKWVKKIGSLMIAYTASTDFRTQRLLELLGFEYQKSKMKYSVFIWQRK